MDTTKYTTAVLSWACYNHAIADTAGFATVTTSSGISQREALIAWLATNPFVTIPMPKTRLPPKRETMTILPPVGGEVAVEDGEGQQRGEVAEGEEDDESV